jgi:hypothetical protein
MLRNCVFGAYRASATKSCVLSIISLCPATIRLDNVGVDPAERRNDSNSEPRRTTLRNFQRQFDPLERLLSRRRSRVRVPSLPPIGTPRSERAQSFSTETQERNLFLLSRAITRHTVPSASRSRVGNGSSVTVAILKQNQMIPVEPRLNLTNAVHIHNDGTMDAQKSRGFNLR